MKIVFVEPRYHSNQVPSREYLIDKGHEIHNFVSYYGATEKHGRVIMHILPPNSISKRIEKHFLKRIGENETETKMQFWFLPERKQVKKLLREISPDIVIIREHSVYSASVYLLCKSMKINTVTFNETPIKQEKSAFYVSIAKKLWGLFFPKYRYSPVEYYSYPFDRTKEYMIDDRAFFIPYVPRNNSLFDRDYCDNGIVRILDSGKYRYIKNHFIIVDAIELVVADGYTNFHALIQGNCESVEEKDYFSRLQKKIDELHLNDYVSLKGTVPYDEMNDLFLENDIYILPSIRDCANISVVDAMSYGLATISTDNNGTASYIEDGINGSVFHTKDARDLADKIEVYLANIELIKEHGKSAMSSIVNNNNLEVFYSKFMKMLSETQKKKERF